MQRISIRPRHALALAGSLLVSSAAAQNDECTGAVPVTLGTTAFDTTTATNSTPTWSCGSGVGRDLWYEFTAPMAGAVSIQTCGSGFDTVLEVFGGTCDNPTLLACNDDVCDLQSVVGVSVSAGQSLLFRIGGFGGEFGSGSFEITIAMPTGNDECASALPLVDGATAFTTVGSTTSAPPWPCASGGADIWYWFVASGPSVTVNTFGSAYDTALELFEGDCGSLTSIVCNDDVGGLQSEVTANTTPGLVYSLRVGGFNGDVGTGVLNVDGTTPVDPGTNFCTPVPNSTGAPGVMSATGSAFVLDNDLTLIASSLPTDATAFFLVSQTQGFVPHPGGSAGNLCIIGDIGRYVGPQQILDSGALGEVQLTIDLAMTPTMSGFTAVVAGEAWNFQCWHRDKVGGSVTSNFTDGLEVDFF
ncbi:MAG: hypothetical protein AAGB93_01515 [Planctomycetota bacterium]